jgi:cytochrome c oxidase assembly protein subunit 15
MASLFYGLRRAAPRLSQNFFICHQCMKQSRHAIGKAPVLEKFTLRSGVRFGSVAAHTDSAAGKSSPLASLSQTIATTHVGRSQTVRNSGSAKGFFPETSSKIVAYWLLGSAASVFGIVVFGGLTRLTESGYFLYVDFL